MDLKNKLTQIALSGLAKKYLLEDGLKGIYVYLDNDGKLQLKDCINDPFEEIEKLKKLLYGQ